MLDQGGAAGKGAEPNAPTVTTYLLSAGCRVGSPWTGVSWNMPATQLLIQVFSRKLPSGEKPALPLSPQLSPGHSALSPSTALDLVSARNSPPTPPQQAAAAHGAAASQQPGREGLARNASGCQGPSGRVAHEASRKRCPTRTAAKHSVRRRPPDAMNTSGLKTAR